jgi:glycerophosphoryl diester phosphodiesterase
MTFVIAHRGSSSRARENTLAAFDAAADLGAPWVELDVRAAADGVPIVVHDQPPAAAAADRPRWMPTLAEALERCAARGLGVVVEVKEVGIARTTSEMLAGLDQPLVVSSFHPMALRDVDAVDRALLVAPGADGADAIRVAVDLGCVALHPHGSLVTAELVDRCRTAGLDVVAWTVNERRHLEKMRDLAVAAVITDDVALAREVLGS